MRISTGFLVAGTALAVSACGVNVGGPTTVKHEDRAYELKQGPVTQLSLGLDSSTATVVGTDTTKITVHERLSYSKNRKPTPHHTVTGSQLSLGYSCPRGINIGFSRCDVGYRIEVPRAPAINVGSDSGSLSLSGLSGPVSAHADSGSLQLTDYRGAKATLSADSGSIRVDGTTAQSALDLSADSGSIRATGPKGGRGNGKVPSGSFRADFAAPPSFVDITVDSGSVHL